VNTAIILSLPISFLLVGFLVLKSVQLGLKWQLQIEAKEVPTLTIPNPIADFNQHRNQAKQEKFTNDVLDEWLNGSKEGE
jgi:hypothetical protein